MVVVVFLVVLAFQEEQTDYVELEVLPLLELAEIALNLIVVVSSGLELVETSHVGKL